MQNFLSNIRHSLRALRRTPGFALVAILTLGLGIGGVTTMFSFVDAVLLRPLPFADPDRLVMVWSYNAGTGSDSFSSSYPDYEDLRDGNRSLTSMAAIFPTTVHLTTPDTAPERLDIYTDVFTNVGIAACAAAVLLVLLSPLIKKGMHGIR